MKWSDGHPFTADDWMFWYESIALNEQLNPVKMQAWLVDGQMFKMTKIDDYTIRLDFAAPIRPSTSCSPRATGMANSLHLSIT